MPEDHDLSTSLAGVLDRSTHYFTSRMTLGLSPAAVAEAYFDWLIHLAASPGKRLQLIEKAARKTARLARHAVETRVWSTNMSRANHSHFTIFAPSTVIQPVADSIVEFNDRAFTGWVEINREWTAFLTPRLQKDVALIHHLATCSNLQGIYGVYVAFFRKAFADYQCEFTEMLQLGQQSLADTTASQKVKETATRQAGRYAT